MQKQVREGLSDRSSRPRRLARLTPADVEGRVYEARPRLADVDRVTEEVRTRGPVTWVRYERESPGELVHVDVKKVPRIPDGGGHRALGRRCGSAWGAGVACLHVAVDDLGRVAYAELLPDERKGTCAAFMGRCLRFFEGMGVRVERMSSTLLAQEWQYARAWDSEAGRASALPAFIERYILGRSHSACGGLPPMLRIVDVNNLSAHNS